ncbi:MAG: ATP-dependent zinc metalloprotease FtsH [Anaerolineaceae bacterium 46_22]|nr:MAG: ATP-dependent zinc metalloprotease FtsH [Anaerolineaceae bacterium 46_22]
MKSGNQSFIIYIMLFIAIIAMVFFTVNQQAAGVDEIPINQVATDLKAGKIDSIIEDDSFLEITYKNSDEIKTSTKDPSSPLIEQLVELGVQPEDLSADKVSIDIKLPSPVLGIVSIASYILPFLLFIGMLFFIFRQAQGSNNAAMSFGKSKARMFSGDHPTVTFEDVAGVDEAKEELQEVVEFLREPQKFIALGARIPKGVLLVGAPGTGKTLMAKAVSGEAGVPFFSISGSEFVEMFVGVGASRVRDLFEQAKRHSPAIVFVDEIDAVGRHRGAGLGGSHDEREQTLNQLLVEMDGFDTDTNVIIIAATNRPDILDPALLRPGRFDRRVVLDRPDIKGREQILNVHVKGKPVSPDVDLYDIARSTPGFVGADIENLVNEAAILAARRDKKIIEHSEFMEAIERVIAGPERKSRLINEDEKKIIAYHEAGHAVVLNALPEADTVQKVSIISRGDAGGYTMAFPEQDRVLKSRRQIMSDMIGLLGGRAAEEVVFNDITSGASNDLERVTKLARTMVMRLGMSEELGQMVYGKKEELVFLGREISEQRDYSEHIAEKIDTAIQNIVQDAYKRSKDILIQYREELDKIAKKLLEVETLDADALYEIFPTPVEKNGGIPEIVNL